MPDTTDTNTFIINARTRNPTSNHVDHSKCLCRTWRPIVGDTKKGKDNVQCTRYPSAGGLYCLMHSQKIQEHGPWWLGDITQPRPLKPIHHSGEHHYWEDQEKPHRNPTPSTRSPKRSLEDRQSASVDHSKCLCRIWKGGLDNIQCSSKKVNGDYCDRHFKFLERDGEWWLGLVTEPRPERPVGPPAKLDGTPSVKPAGPHEWTPSTTSTADVDADLWNRVPY